MEPLKRNLIHPLKADLERGKSILLLGPRQTGKTTLVQQIGADHMISLIQPGQCQRYEKDLDLLTYELEQLQQKLGKPPLVVIDEVQKLPRLLDSVQDLIDRQVAQFVLTGSSARQLRRYTDTNWLPGRVLPYRLDALTLKECAPLAPTLETLLLYGSLPGIMTEPADKHRNTDLRAYVSTYLEEEIRQEAAVRNVALFSQFLDLAAAEAGSIVNFNKLSQEIGISQSTITAYYQILVDCLIAEMITPITQSKTRRRLSKKPKYLFFDLGVRRRCTDEGEALSPKQMGQLFEQWVGLELLRYLRIDAPDGSLHYWRDPAGPEVDWVVKCAGQFIPFEVKWTQNPKPTDAKHLKTFLKEYPEAKQGYVVCRCQRPIALADNITAIPWDTLTDTL